MQEIANIMDKKEANKIKYNEAEAERENNNLVVKDVDKLNDYTYFEVILPRYLPEGYKFDRAEFFRDENEVVENIKAFYKGEIRMDGKTEKVLEEYLKVCG